MQDLLEGGEDSQVETDLELHKKALDQVLHKLQDAGLTANLEKCEFRKP